MWGTATCVKNRSVCRISTNTRPPQKPVFAAGAHRKPQNSRKPQQKCVHSAASLCTPRPRRGRGVRNVRIHRVSVASKWSVPKKVPTTPSIAPFGVAKSVPRKCVPSAQSNPWVGRARRSVSAVPAEQVLPPVHGAHACSGAPRFVVPRLYLPSMRRRLRRTAPT